MIEILSDSTGQPEKPERNLDLEAAAYGLGVSVVATFILFACLLPWAAAWLVGP